MKGLRFFTFGIVFSFFLTHTALAAVPAAPTNLQSAWVDTTTAVLVWDASADAASYNVYRFDSVNQNWIAVDSQLSVPFFREIPAATDSVVNYSVTAVNAAGESAPSTTAITVGGWPDIVISPDDPQWNSWMNGRTETTVAFGASPVSGVDAILEFGSSPEDLEFYAYQSDYSGFHSFLVTNLTPATLYYYRLTYSGTNRLGMSYNMYVYTLPPDMPPQVFPSDVEMDEDSGPLFIVPNGWDLDTYGPLALRVVRPPDHGTVTLDESGSGFLYTPAANFCGMDSFDFVMNDGELDSDPATISITVHSVNDPGVITTGSLDLTTADNAPVSAGVFVYDLEGDSQTLRVLAPPESGSIQINGTNFIFTPVPNFTGQIHFQLGAVDTSGLAAVGSAQVTVHVVHLDAPPVAQPVAVSTAEDTAIAITLGAADPDGGPAIWSVVSGPVHGTLSGTPPNLTYTPVTNYSGPDSFVFSVGNGAAPASTATVAITVNPVDDPPVGQNSAVNTLEDNAITCLILATDIEGDALTFEVVRRPAHGTLGSFGSTPYSVTYIPAPDFFGADSFDLRANDGVQFGNVFTISVTVTAVDDAPIALAQSFSTAEDQALTLTLAATDVDGGPLNWQIVSSPAHGVLSGTAPNLTYTPDANYFGTDMITVSADNGQLPASQALITIQVIAVDDPPVALPQNLTTAEDQPLAITLTASDIDGGPVSWQIISGPAHGTLSGALPNVTYSPAANYNGQDSFRFAAAPGSEAVITIQVTPVNDAPIAAAQSVTTPYNTAVNITLGATDVDSSSLSYSVLTSPANGALSGTAPNLVFTPTIGWFGTTSFNFRASDGALNSATATVTIIVQNTATTPAAPSALTAQAVSTTQINLTWTDNSDNEDGFRIERATGSTFTEIATVGPNVHTFSSTGLSANKTYNYRVRAYNVRGNSAYSNTASAKTPSH